MKTEINFNHVKYLVESQVFLTKGQTTIVVNFNNKTLWISILVTPLENKYFSYKQFNFNYNNHVFTRAMEKKHKDNDKEILLCRNVDRSIRPYLPDNFPYNIAIESWNLSVSDDDVWVPLLLGISCGLLSLNIIDYPVMPVILNQFNLTATVYNHKISNLEMGWKPTPIEDIIGILGEKTKEYHEYTQSIVEVFNWDNYYQQVNEFSLEQNFAIKQTMEMIKEFQQNYHQLHDHLHSIVDVIISRINDRVYNQFVHGHWDKHIDQWILDQLNSVDIINIKFFTEQIFTEVKKKLFCNNLIKTKIRQDGRSFDESRPIILEPCPLSNFHNSVCLVKGKTRLLIGGYFLAQDRNYDHKVHVKYIFNPFINPKRSSNRREIGHGHLIEKSINKVVGDNRWKAFFNCYITNSDGSSSMLSVIGCGLMTQKFQWSLDKISGISIGLIEDKKENFLVDIAENEDFYCSMDMKITSTKNGIVAIQLDVKNQGIDLKLLEKALKLGYKQNNKTIKQLYKSELKEIQSHYYNKEGQEFITCKNHSQLK
jgi:polyribonucleotide nucleotidyltransferase